MFTGPFAGIERLLIDGNNLLHRMSGGAGEGALRGLLARLRGAVPSSVRVIVMLDGHPTPGAGRSQRVSPHIEVRHSGSMSADDALLALARERSAGTTLVTDDRALRDRATSHGVHTFRLDWLESVMSVPVTRPAVGLGNRRPGNPPSNRRSARERDRP